MLEASILHIAFNILMGCGMIHRFVSLSFIVLMLVLGKLSQMSTVISSLGENKLLYAL